MKYSVSQLYELQKRSPLTPLNKGGTGKAPLLNGGWGDQAPVPQQTEKCYI